MGSDRIEKRTVLNASLDRVWHAVSDSAEFGKWFGMSIDGPFVAGTGVSAVITPTAVDQTVAERQAPHAGRPSPLQIVEVEPRRKLAFRWNPLPDSDITTLVEFTLTEVDDGVLLEIVESGFDGLPPDKRESLFEGNSQGWTTQTELVGKYLELHP